MRMLKEDKKLSNLLFVFTHSRIFSDRIKDNNMRFKHIKTVIPPFSLINEIDIITQFIQYMIYAVLIPLTLNRP